MGCCKVFVIIVGIVFLVILYAVFFAALIIGASRINLCPAEPRLPIWLIIFGSLGIAFGIYIINHMVSKSLIVLTKHLFPFRRK